MGIVGTPPQKKKKQKKQKKQNKTKINKNFAYILGKVHMCLRKVKFLLFRFNIQSFELIIQHSHPSLYSTKTFYHWYISDRYG